MKNYFFNFTDRIGPSRHSKTFSSNPKSGQTLLFILLILLFLLIVVIWQFDLHKILFVKHLSRNGGDAAATTAARWQGHTLNVIGELNIMQAISITESLSRGETNFPEAVAIADLQARLNYVGPLMGFLTAQQAAKNNRIYENEDFTRLLRNHANEVQEDYPVRYPTQPWIPATDEVDPWQRYSDMLKAIASEGIAVDAENRRLYLDYQNRNHLLLNPSFYDAISSRDWCWMYFNARAELYGYSSYTDWPELPLIQEPEPINSEYFGLFLSRVSLLSDLSLDPAPLLDEMNAQSDAGAISLAAAEVPATWYVYRSGDWSSWTDSLPESFPWDRSIREQYDYKGADAAVRIETDADRLTPGANPATIRWSAAAKPFGSLDDSTPPNAYGLVLPSFTDVRLIPLDASTAPAGGSRPGWATFIYEDLPIYVSSGPDSLPPSWYANQLLLWEQASFRQEAIDWLSTNSASCRQPGGGPGSSGGTRRGH